MGPPQEHGSAICPDISNKGEKTSQRFRPTCDVSPDNTLLNHSTSSLPPDRYIVPTSGKPLRGIIQDHIAGAVLIMARNTMFTKGQVCQLLYTGLRSQMEGRKKGHWLHFPDLNELGQGRRRVHAGTVEGILGMKKGLRTVARPRVGSAYAPLELDPPALKCAKSGVEMYTGRTAGNCSGCLGGRRIRCRSPRSSCYRGALGGKIRLIFDLIISEK